MKAIKFLFRYSGGAVVLAMAAGIISGASNAGLLALIHSALSRPGTSVKTLVWGFAALCLLLPTTRIVSQLMLSYLAQRATYDLRMRLCHQILATPLRNLEEVGGPRLLAALTDDISAISMALISIPALCLHGTILVGCLVYLGWLSPGVLVGVVTFILFGVLSYQLAVKQAMRYIKLAREEQDAVFKHFRALIEGAKELRLNKRRRRVFFSDTLQSAALTSRRHNIKASTFFISAAGWSQFLFFALVGLLLFVLPQVENVSQQVLTGYIIVLLYLLTPLEVISATVPNLGRANVALKKVESLGLSLANSVKEQDLDSQPEAAPVWQQLELAGATHAYHRELENGSFMLGPIDLTLRPGELVFLVGGNGSGKTTLAKMLAGLYMPGTGEVRLNGEPVTDKNRDSYRQLFSAVFADFYLFENLIGLDSVELDAQARRYLTQLQLDHKVEINGGILSSTDLSQGQRKRLALLNTYLEDRPIYIFDEWAADQDPFFKKVFYYEILPSLKAKGKTVLVISHDDRYYQMADRIIKLESGQIEFDNQTRSVEDPPSAVAVPVS